MSPTQRRGRATPTDRRIGGEPTIRRPKVADERTQATPAPISGGEHSPATCSAWRRAESAPTLATPTKTRMRGVETLKKQRLPKRAGNTHIKSSDFRD